MNFFKALLNINSLRGQIANLEQTNLELASHNLQLQGQMESIRNFIHDQSHTISKLRSENDKMHSELSKLKSLKRNQKPNSNPAPSMAAPTPKQKKPQGFTATPNNNPQQSQPRRGRKPKTANQ